jgi:hypothetical protein
MNKDEILDALEDSREEFLDTLEGLAEAALLEPGVVGEWSIKDVLAHLVAWETELVKLLWQVHNGDRPTTIHFGKVDVDARNAALYLEFKDRPWERIWADFTAVRKQTIRRVEPFSDSELTEARHFPYLKEKALWEWIAGDSFDHEREHAAEIKAWRAARGI